LHTPVPEQFRVGYFAALGGDVLVTQVAAHLPEFRLMFREGFILDYFMVCIAKQFVVFRGVRLRL